MMVQQPQMPQVFPIQQQNVVQNQVPVNQNNLQNNVPTNPPIVQQPQNQQGNNVFVATHQTVQEPERQYYPEQSLNWETHP